MKVVLRWSSRARARKIEPENRAADPAPAVPENPDNLDTQTLEPGIIEGLMLEAYGASDPGCVRTNNEDYHLVVPEIGLYLVADGMGGAQAGEHASKLAADTVCSLVQQANGQVDQDLLEQSFNEANHRVMEAAQADSSMQGMGTTLVAAVEKNGELLVASVGDSRLYTFRDGTLTSVTDDQTWVNEVGRRLGIDEESLRTHPMRHVLTMAIGVSDQLRVNTYTLKPEPGTYVMMCSDGLHGVAQEADIQKILGGEGSLKEKCAKLIAVAKERGGPDNITVVLLHAS